MIRFLPSLACRLLCRFFASFVLLCVRVFVCVSCLSFLVAFVFLFGVCVCFGFCVPVLLCFCLWCVLFCRCCFCWLAIRGSFTVASHFLATRPCDWHLCADSAYIEQRVIISILNHAIWNCCTSLESSSDPKVKVFFPTLTST